MQPSLWHPAVELSAQEEQIVKRTRKAKLFVFLRQHRHELFDDPFQEELAGLYRVSERGQPPIAPAQLALATILQAYTGASDDEARDRHADGSSVADRVGLSGRRSRAIRASERWWHFASD